MSVRLKDTIEDSVDKLDGYHRSNLFESIPAWINASGLSKTFTVGGDSNNFYPVVISLSSSKDFPTEISIYKNLGSATPSISGNHSNGTSSLWLRYEARYTGWDGNGGYVKTLYKSQPYATLVAHATANFQNNGGLVVWLRGGTCEYKIACTNTFTTTIYYETVNIGTSSSVQNIGPLTAVDNGGIYTSTTYIGYGNISGNASTATKLSTARTISLTGSVTGSGTFDGSGNLSIATTTNHTHNYAGSSSAGGAATSANKLNTDKGSATNPVYFSGGVPVACTYSLNATVPSNAKFTDTNTWRGITDSYSGTDSTISLSQKGGKALYDALVNGYASSAGNADTLDNYHASSFGIWRGNVQTDPEADDTTYTTTANFLNQIHTRTSIFNSNFSAFRGSWYYVGNVNYDTGVGSLEMAGTAVLNISGNCTNDVNYKSLMFLDRNGELFSYVSQEAGVATWSKYAKSSEIKNATITIKQAGTSKGSFTLNQSSNVTIELTDSNTNTTYSAGSGLSLSGTTFNHASSVTAGTAGTSSATSGSTLAVPYVTVNATGHVTGYGTHTHTVSGFAASSHSHTTYVLKAGDVMTGPLRFERPTTSNNNYNEGARFNLGGASSWAGFTIGNAAGSTEGNAEGAYAFLVNNKNFYIRHKDANFLTVDTSKNILWNPGLFAIVTGQTECGIRFRVASSSGDFVGRYSSYVSLFNANNPYSEVKIHDSNNEVTVGIYNQKNRLVVNGIGNVAGFYSQIYAASPNEASITFSNSSLQSDANFFTVGMTHSDNLFWVHSGKKAGRILTGNGSGYINIPNRLAIGTTSAPSYPLQVSGEGYFSNTLYINKSSTACALSLVHTSSSYPWCWQRFVSNNQEWHVGVCSDSTSGTNRLNAGSFEIRGRGQSDEGIFIRQETSSYGKLVVANNSNTETSIGYLNTNHSNTYPVWTVGCGIGTGVRSFGWWYQPANGSGGACKMYLGESGDLHITSLYIGSDAITFVT